MHTPHIFRSAANAKNIVSLAKEGSRLTKYQLSDNTMVERQQPVNVAKQGQIAPE